MMTKETIVKYTTEELRKLEMNGGDKTDWQRIYNLKDEDIKYDEDSPEITTEMFSEAIAPQPKTTEIKLSLDSDMVEWYISQKIAYQSLINTLLRSYMEAHSYNHQQ